MRALLHRVTRLEAAREHAAFGTRYAVSAVPVPDDGIEPEDAAWSRELTAHDWERKYCVP